MILDVINNGIVGIFGCILAASFSGSVNTKRRKEIYCIFVAALLLVQAVVYYAFDEGLTKMLYPLITHIPIALVLCAFSGKYLWSITSVLLAYLFCEVRRWIGLIVIAVFAGDHMLQNAVEIIVTVPLLILILKLLMPSVRMLSKRNLKGQINIFLVPAVFYTFDYVTVVYTDLLMSGIPAVLEFMPFICCVAYTCFLFYTAEEERKRLKLTEMQKSLDAQLSQAVREIAALRTSKDTAARYIHDMRHHLQYISACIENDQKEAADAYIKDIFEGFKAMSVKQFCTNEAANLIISSFASRAEAIGIKFETEGHLPQSIKLPDSDLCVMLSNALENAIKATARVKKKEKKISLKMFVKEDVLFIQLANTYQGQIMFENGVPVSKIEGHGIGVQSICAVIERHGGMYDFSCDDETFILRISV